ncbi:MAG: valine--tRNA ligase [candidate division Zixibacteria bacterium]|nr:valine--tRNA ligase [candidate division Zixibacteria bacterium]
MTDIPKAYNPKLVEDVIYKKWLDSGIFHGQLDNDKEPYSIVIPPPNVTDILHLGHALNNTLQDILIRWKKMQGRETEWLPGVDHAGIATQVVVEKALAREGRSRHDIGREKFVQKVWKWKEEKFDRIIKQLQKIGCACDWDRTRFTMDEGLSKAVIEVFCRLYEKGLIYRGERIVNWCPDCLTTLSDDEIERDEVDSFLWYIKYKIKGSDEYVIIATTRPETMLGDTAIAVNPADERFKELIGKSAILPIMDRELPIIADDYVDMEFGTGALKITPAHDPNDFDIGIRHSLERINILSKDGTLNENAGKFAGLDRYDARKKIVEELKEKGHLDKIENYSLISGTCYRCHTVVEPYLSKQWFVKMKPLAKPAIDSVKSGRIKFHPEHWVKTYLHWMENVRDWCISRQLWWGHRIPVYYCDDCQEIMVARSKPEKCSSCGSKNLRQDEDVLDTWFSSWLWPFSTFGWPEKTAELDKYFPTKALVTGSEIIYLWVARMVMGSLEFMGKEPFSDVYIHGTVRDADGIKMSKSLGNGIDPLLIIDKYGADALRVSLILETPEGQDPHISEKTFEIGRNFANKLWSASRFVRLNMGDFKLAENLKITESHLEMPDKWILSRLAKSIGLVNNYLSAFRFSTAAKAAYDFIWNDYCSNYLEMLKPRYFADKELSDPAIRDSIQAARECSGYVLLQILKLLHPFMPFVTEEIWSLALENDGKDSISTKSWPEPMLKFIDDELERDMEKVIELAESVRIACGELSVPPAKKPKVLIRCENDMLVEIFNTHKNEIRNLARSGEVEASIDIKKPPLSASAIVPGAEIFIPLEGLIDIEQEKARLEKLLDEKTQYAEKLSRKLNNHDFINRAPAEVVEADRGRLKKTEELTEKLNKNLESLSGW